MPNRRLTRLAWLSLTHNKTRLLASLGGVAFAVVLMFIEIGFLNGLNDTQTYMIKMLNADLIMMQKNKEAFLPNLPFPKKRLLQARGLPGVQAVYPLYFKTHGSRWKNEQDKHEHPILVFAFDPDHPVFLIPEVSEQAGALQMPDTALIDAHGRDFFGDRVAGTEAELSGHKIRIVGTFPLGPDYRVDGNLLVSDRTFFKCFTEPGSGVLESAKVELGLIKVAPGADVAEVQDQLKKILPGDVKVLTKQEFIDQIKAYWSRAQPVGFVFGLGALVGFVIGVTICYQIIYTDIADHLPQYATLKAIGYGNHYLIKVVLQEALYLAMLGFFPGLLASLAAYGALHAASGIRMDLTLGRSLWVFVFTVAMCGLSGLIAIRKATTADPAEVF